MDDAPWVTFLTGAVEHFADILADWESCLFNCYEKELRCGGRLQSTNPEHLEILEAGARRFKTGQAVAPNRGHCPVLRKNQGSRVLRSRRRRIILEGNNTNHSDGRIGARRGFVRWQFQLDRAHNTHGEEFRTRATPRWKRHSARALLQ